MKRLKKKKLSIKKLLFLLIPLVLAIVIFVNRYNILYFYQSKVTGYPKETVSTLHKFKIYDKVKKHTYSETLDKMVNSQEYNQKYVSNYLDITYKDSPNFLSNLNKLLSLGYKEDEINTIYSSLSLDSIDLLLEDDYLKDIINILKLSYFHEDNLKRYLTYRKDKELDYEDLITYVNINLDYDYYTNVTDITDPNDTLVIVNKYHKLASDYVPSDLQDISPKYNKGYNGKMRTVAKEAFEKMCEAALQDNIYIYSGSAYRSYNYQLNLYNRYVANNGFAEAETFSARAGHSEHQTGLATDIMNKRIDYISENDTEYTWLINNSYKYGFILRYPKGKESITGYMYEEWHFRYVGEEIAEYLYKNDLTFEEYIARKNS